MELVGISKGQMEFIVKEYKYEIRASINDDNDFNKS